MKTSNDAVFLYRYIYCQKRRAVIKKIVFVLGFVSSPCQDLHSLLLWRCFLTDVSEYCNVVGGVKN